MKFVATTLSAAMLTFAGVGCDDAALAPMDDSEQAAPESAAPADRGQDYGAEPLDGGQPGAENDPGLGSPQAPAGEGTTP